MVTEKDNIKKETMSKTYAIKLSNGKSVLDRIEKSKNDPNRNKSYYTLIQTNTFSQPYTDEKSMKANSIFIVNCNF